MPSIGGSRIAPAAIVGFFALTIGMSIMGIYETAIDTILVSFLEDEAENDDNGNITFASGELSQFMKAKYSYQEVNGVNERRLFTTQTFASPVLMQSVM